LFFAYFLLAYFYPDIVHAYLLKREHSYCMRFMLK